MGIAVSVIITTYNSSSYIRDTLNSILSQSFSEFELLIGDDGSEDDTCKIVENYTDLRIHLIRCQHNFINTENTLLYEARGKYIARIDHDDQMLPDRLKIQFEYMEAHNEIDVLGGGMFLFGSMSGITNPLFGRAITLSDMYKGNCVANPTVLIRRESIAKIHLLYEADYIFADDYRFWSRMIRAGLHIENLPIVLTAYRVSSRQASAIYSQKQAESVKLVKKDLEKWIIQNEVDIYSTSNVKENKNKLTIILPFCEEGEDVINTVKNIRSSVNDKVDIIVINDRSFDNYHYGAALASYSVSYIYNDTKKGRLASQNVGIFACKTPYFLVIDSKMEFYGYKWLDRIIVLLNNNNNQLLCLQTRFNEKFNKNYNVIFSCGEYPLFEKTGQIPMPIHSYIEKYLVKEMKSISFLLSVGYATSLHYWKKVFIA